MTNTKKPPTTKPVPTNIRLMQAPPHDASDSSTLADLQVVAHDLRVHQIELEMQNEELRRIQAELDTARAHYFNLYNLAPVGYCSINKAGLVLQINLTAAVLFGIPQESLVAQPFIRLILQEDRDVFYLLNRHLVTFKDAQRCELRMLKKDGSTFWANLAVSTVLENDEVIELRIVLFDVTDHRNTQNELQKSNIELSRAKKNLEAANAKMMLYQQQLLGLVAHQQNIKEAERIRIAREIHDELGSTLTAIKANLSVAMHEDEISEKITNQRLSDACALVDVAMNAVRRVITELRPSVLDQLGVWAALEWYAEQVELRTGIHCHIDLHDHIQETPIDADRSTALFRILQESLTNVTRHADAAQVSIRVTLEQNVVVMEIEDNGKGIDMAPFHARGSWGIAGMAERARFFGGDLEIKNLSPGTLVTLRLPLEKNDD